LKVEKMKAFMKRKNARIAKNAEKFFGEEGEQ